MKNVSVVLGDVPFNQMDSSEWCLLCSVQFKLDRV